jgi:hypothetical protein
MKPRMPRSLIAAQAAIGTLVVYQAVVLALDIRWGKSLAATISILNLVWTAVSVTGIAFKYRLAWRLACAVSVVLGGLAVVDTAVFLLLALQGREHFAFYTVWYSCTAIYMLTLYYLLRRPTVVDYFKKSGGEFRGRGSSGGT